MFKMSCVLECALCGVRIGTHLCILLVFISNYTTMHGAEYIKLVNKSYITVYRSRNVGKQLSTLAV